MIQGYYTASSAMLVQQQRIDAISNNIANIDTDGYKKTNVDFTEVLSSVYQNGDEAGEGAYVIGNGVMISSPQTDFSGGFLTMTDKALDLSIRGEGFFTLRGENGQMYYSRGGSFNLQAKGDSTYIVNSDGYTLLGEDMNPVEMNGDECTILSSGTVLVDGSPTCTLRVVSFNNPNGLEQVGNDLYKSNEQSGENTGTVGRVVQGALEKSNVNLAEEMTDLIKVQRIYQLNSKIVQTIDGMQGMANALRK